jgi:rhodanese-related sulfurtransferase
MSRFMRIDLEKLQRMQMLHVGFLLFDLRTPEEFSKGHFKNAFNLPAATFLERLAESVKSKDAAVVIYHGPDVDLTPILEGCEHLGYINIVGLEGGYDSMKGLE